MNTYDVEKLKPLSKFIKKFFKVFSFLNKPIQLFKIFIIIITVLVILAWFFFLFICIY